jgi:LacI family transcriptional regulator
MADSRAMARKQKPGPAAVVRLEDVARRAGVSSATASRAINGTSGRVVGADLRERVLQAAAELGYMPNAHAQAMARGRANAVGLVVHDIADPYFSSVAAGVMRAAKAEGLLVTLASTQRSQEEELSYVAAFRREKARAIVIVGSRSNDRTVADRLAAELAAFEAEGGRAVAVSQPRLPVDTIAIQNREGATALALALHDLGYRSFAVLGGPEDLLTGVDRVTGFREGLAQRGTRLAAGDVVYGGFTRDGGYESMERYLDAGGDAECVFAANDVMAVGAMACLRDRGVALPGGVAVAGFDDIVTLRDITPSLTTVRVALEDVGVRATELALGEAGRRARTETVSCEVVLRASTPPKTPA